ncbi:hypothetical protein QJQ45_020525 [Haematococcus lacustris]|nr:hypothetical protein QJQ45_020525 [Haematococcus lacustris]
MSSGNIFAALDKAKKKKSKSSTKEHKESKPVVKEPEISKEELERAIFSQPANTISNWADDSEEDDYYPAPAAAPAEPVEDGWSKATGGGGRANRTTAPASTLPANGKAEDSEDEEDEEDEADPDVEAVLGVDAEDEEEFEEKVTSRPEPKPVASVAAATPKPVIEPEKQLSKKELKKKEMEEMEAVLAQLGITAAEAAAAEAGAAAEKRRKKKEKQPCLPAAAQLLQALLPDDLPPQGKAAQEEGRPDSGLDKDVEPASAPAPAQAAQEEGVAARGDEEDGDDQDSVPVDPAAVKARLAAAKKKTDAKKKTLSSAALAEAQARKAKLSRQKDTKSYNQAAGQPHLTKADDQTNPASQRQPLQQQGKALQTGAPIEQGGWRLLRPVTTICYRDCTASFGVLEKLAASKRRPAG